MTNETKKPRTGPKTWKKGQSGNPGGRSPRVGPNGETLATLIRGRTKELVDRAFEVSLAKDTEPKDALAGIFGLLDRGWGKPKEQEAPGGGKDDLGKALLELISRLPS